MKSTARTILMIGLIALGISTMIPGAVLAEDKPEADLSTGIYSQYVWRGFAFSDSSMVIQPSMSVSYKGFGANFWGNLDTDMVGADSKDFNETDLTLSYDGSAGKIGYGVGWIYYNVDGTDDDTQEVYVSMSADAMLAPTLTVYADIESSSAIYATLGVSHSVPVAEGMALDLGAQIGYMDNDAGYSEFHDGLISASMSFTVNNYLSITPELYYSFALTNDSELAIAGGSEDGDDSHVFGGVSASFAF